MIRTVLIGSDGVAANETSVLMASDLFFAEMQSSDNVARDAAIAAPKLIPPLPAWVRGRWPMWQISTRFSAGAVKTADLVIHVRDEATQQWHALALIETMDAAAVTPDAGQVVQIEAPAGKDAMALQITLGDAQSDVIHITVRGVAYVQVAL